MGKGSEVDCRPTATALLEQSLAYEIEPLAHPCEREITKENTD